MKSLSLCRLQLGTQNLTNIETFLENNVFYAICWKLPWKWISGGHLSSELQDLIRLEMFVKTAFLHFPLSSYIKRNVSRKLSMKSTKTMGAIT